ncbi:hypothetical protein V5O48_009668 [Marasmius crinis-equi]|uniref:Nephrocystin 3-like N-terminal domain-containing protein n=1 Tax=Marasmius crinis-equi TaxID=585013 RepID=A0ABR3FAP2_9AGAR
MLYAGSNESKELVDADSEDGTRSSEEIRPGNERGINTCRAIVDVLHCITRVLDRVGDVIPCTPLKVVTSGLIELFNLYQKRADNKERFAGLLASLQSLESLLRPYRDRDTTVDDPLRERLDQLSADFAQHEDEIRARTEQQKSLLSKVKRYLLIREDARFLSDLAGKIAASVDHIMLGATMQTYVKVQGIDENVDYVKDLLILGHLPSIKDAAYNARELRPTCWPNTREQILRELHEWACSEKSEQVRWLCGPSGSGKSAIAYSFCERIEAARTTNLFASFFCLESYTIQHLAPTITAQLAFRYLPFKRLVKNVIAADSGVGNRKIAEQLEKLLVAPLRTLFAKHPLPVILVIDGLEVCTRKDEGHLANIFLREILKCVPRIPSLKVLISCQSATRSRLNIPDTPNAILLGPEKHNVDRDIRLYFTSRLEELNTPRANRKINVSKVIQKADGSFFCVRHMLELLESSYDQLSAFLDADETLVGLEAVQASYEHLLADALSVEDRALQQRLCSALLTMACIRESLSVSDTAVLLGMTDIHRLQVFLERLSSVGLRVEDGFVSFTLHPFKDFLFASHQTSPGSILQCAPLHHYRMAIQLLRFMSRLRRNPLDLHPTQALGGRDRLTEIAPTLQYACRYWAYHLDCGLKAVGSSAGTILQEVLDELVIFAQKHLLHWIEVLCILGSISVAEQSLELAKDWVSLPFLSDKHCGFLVQLFQDALASIHSCRKVIEQYPQQVYESLLFPPAASTLATTYDHVQPFVAGVQTQLMRQSLSVDSEGSDVVVVSLSPDCKYLASIHSSGALRVWDTLAGHLVSEANGSANGCIVHDIAFVNRRRVVSIALNSEGHYLEVVAWDTTKLQACKHVVPLEKQYSATNPKRPKLVVSSTRQFVAVLVDETATVWDTESLSPTSYQMHIDRLLALSSEYLISEQDVWRAKGARESVHHFPQELACAAFSQDESAFSVKTPDGKVSLYNASTHELLRSFKLGSCDGPSRPLKASSIKFSPDGRHLAVFGPSFVAVREAQAPYKRVGFRKVNKDLRAFDLQFYPESGTFVFASAQKKCDGIAVNSYHVGPRNPSSLVTALAFAPNGDLLAVGYQNGVVAMYERHQHGPLLGDYIHSWHNDRQSHILRLLFSSDGEYLASTSSGSVTTVRRCKDNSTSDPVVVLQVYPDTLRFPVYAFSADSRFFVGVFRLSNRENTDSDLCVEVIDLQTKGISYVLRIRAKFWRSTVSLNDSNDVPRSVAISSDGLACAISFEKVLLVCRNRNSHHAADGPVEAFPEDVKAIVVSDACRCSLSFAPNGKFIKLAAGVYDSRSLDRVGRVEAAHFRLDHCHVDGSWIIDLDGKRRCWIPYGRRDMKVIASCSSQVVLSVDGNIVILYVRS